MGIEPTLVAWEATVLPLNYTRWPTQILCSFLTVSKLRPSPTCRAIVWQPPGIQVVQSGFGVQAGLPGQPSADSASRGDDRESGIRRVEQRQEAKQLEPATVDLKSVGHHELLQARLPGTELD